MAVGDEDLFAGDSSLARRKAEWDVRSGPRNYIVVASAQAVAALAGFASAWLIIRVIGAAGYGGVAAVLAASHGVFFLALHWTSLSVVRFGVEEFVATGKIAESFQSRTAILILNLTAVLLLAPLWLPKAAAFLKVPAQVAPLILLHLTVTAIAIHVQQGLQAAKLPRLQAYLLAAERMTLLVLLVTLSAAGRLSVRSAVIAYAGASALSCLIASCFLRELFVPLGVSTRNMMRRILAYSAPLLPYAWIGYLSSSYLDAAFLSHWVSKSDLGVYTVVLQVSGAVLQLATLAGGLLSPFFITIESEGRTHVIIEYTRDVLPLLVLLWSAFCAAVATVAVYAIPFIFNRAFARASELWWPLLSAAALASPLLLGYGAIAIARSLTYVNLTLAICGGLINVALDILLIPRFGLIGCAWATVVATAISMLVGCYLIGRRVGSSPWRAVIGTLPLLVGAAIALQDPRGIAPAACAFGVLAILAFAYRHTSRIAVRRVWEILRR